MSEAEYGRSKSMDKRLEPPCEKARQEMAGDSVFNCPSCGARNVEYTHACKNIASAPSASTVSADELIEKCAEIAEQEFVSYHSAAKAIRALKGRFTLAAPSTSGNNIVDESEQYRNIVNMLFAGERK